MIFHMMTSFDLSPNYWIMNLIGFANSGMKIQQTSVRCVNTTTNYLSESPGRKSKSDSAHALLYRIMWWPMALTSSLYFKKEKWINRNLKVIIEKLERKQQSHIILIHFKFLSQQQKIMVHYPNVPHLQQQLWTPHYDALSHWW